MYVQDLMSYSADKLHLYSLYKMFTYLSLISGLRLKFGCSSVFPVFHAGCQRCCIASCSSLLIGYAYCLHCVPPASSTGDCFALRICVTCWQLLFLMVVHDFQHSILQMFGSYYRLIIFPVSGIVFYLLAAGSNMMAFITALVKIAYLRLKQQVC